MIHPTNKHNQSNQISHAFITHHPSIPPLIHPTHAGCIDVDNDNGNADGDNADSDDNDDGDDDDDDDDDEVDDDLVVDKSRVCKRQLRP